MKYRDQSAALGETISKQAFDPAAIDIKTFQNLENFFHVDLVVDRPGQHAKVLHAPLEHRKDDVKKFGILKFALEQPEVVVIEFDPERPALQMLKPFGAEKAVPMFVNPGPKGVFAKVAPRFFALDPLMSLGFNLSDMMDAQACVGTRRFHHRGGN